MITVQAPGTVIRFTVGECSLGFILVASSDVGICAITLGDGADVLVVDLRDRFPGANLIAAEKDLQERVESVIKLVEDPGNDLDLPLGIRGTAFQRSVWKALRQIPAGETATYAQIAESIGNPRSVRAVAQACGANPVAVAIPCHRVVRSDGSLSGYRWGTERKAALLERERKGE